MRPHLLEAVKKAIEISNPPPVNEADTCVRIIYPLLLAAGYDYKDIKSQDENAAKGKPDYTLLPESEEHMWFLEAKTWNARLDVQTATQAVNYVNAHGKRWVVLTNGKDWLLYDNDMKGRAEEKLAAEFTLRDKQFVSFLEALSKPSVTGGKLEPFVQNQRLYATLAGQLGDPKSDVVRAIGKVIKAMPGLSRVTNGEVVDYFKESNGVQPGIIASVAREETIQPGTSSSHKGNGLCLTKIDRSDVTGKKPEVLRLGNGMEIKGETWREISLNLAKVLLDQGLAGNVPVFSGKKAKSALVALKGGPGTKGMRSPAEVTCQGRSYVVETHFSAKGHIRMWTILLAAARQSASECELSLALG